MIAIYRGADGFWFETGSHQYHAPEFSLDALFQAAEPESWLASRLSQWTPLNAPVDLASRSWLAPLESQEVWAAGVTYFRSRAARMEESEASGGDVFYDKVYEAERPELFMKATPYRARGHGAQIRVRADSTWDVPEPELTLAINAEGKVFGFTIGNDVSSRSIEGENPLYLPQAKVYRGSCALGPALVVGNVITPESVIAITIARGGQKVFSGDTKVSQIKRGFDELAGFLFRENEFPEGALLMTGTGIVPGNDFSLTSGDIVSISISGLGTLRNEVE